MTPAYKYHKFYLNKLYNCFCGGQRNVRGCQVGKFHTMYIMYLIQDLSNKINFLAYLLFINLQLQAILIKSKIIL